MASKPSRPRVLLDQNAPKRLIRALPDFDIVTARHLGWSQLSNGDLIDAADRARFDVILTADLNLKYQQTIAGRRIAIVVLATNRWLVVARHLEDIANALTAAAPGTFTHLVFEPPSTTPP